MLIEFLERVAAVRYELLQDIEVPAVRMIAVDIAQDAHLADFLTCALSPLLGVLHVLAGSQ